MPKTRGELCERALKMLGATGAGETASAEDTDIVNELIRPTMDELARRGVIYVADFGQENDLGSGSIPDSEFIALAQVLAKAAAFDFGAAFVDFAALANDGEARLRAMQADNEINEPITFVSY